MKESGWDELRWVELRWQPLVEDHPFCSIGCTLSSFATSSQVCLFKTNIAYKCMQNNFQKSAGPNTARGWGLKVTGWTGGFPSFTLGGLRFPQAVTDPAKGQALTQYSGGAIAQLRHFRDLRSRKDTKSASHNSHEFCPLPRYCSILPKHLRFSNKKLPQHLNVSNRKCFQVSPNLNTWWNGQKFIAFSLGKKCWKYFQDLQVFLCLQMTPGMKSAHLDCLYQ